MENSESAIRLCRMAMLISPCKMSATGGYGFGYSQNGYGKNTGRILMTENENRF